MISAPGISASPFNDAHIALAPEGTGVYFLYRHGRVIYIGVAVLSGGALLAKYLRKKKVPREEAS